MSEKESWFEVLVSWIEFFSMCATNPAGVALALQAEVERIERERPRNMDTPPEVDKHPDKMSERELRAEVKYLRERLSEGKE